MATSLSPTARMVNSIDADEPVASKTFSESIKYFQNIHKVLVEMTAYVNRAPGNALKFGNHTFTNKDINQYSKIYISQLGELKKVFNSRRRQKRNKNGETQAKKPYYVSEQIVDFYKSANLGPSDPEKPKSKLSKSISLITDKHIATAGILTSIMMCYIDNNSLNEGSNSGRFMPDDHMKECFSDCIYTLHGKNISKRKCREGTTPEKTKDIKEKVTQGKKSAFDRIKDRIDNSKGEKFYDEEKGLLFTTMMILGSYYRIPDALLTQEEKDVLKDEEVIGEAEELQNILGNITKHRNAKKLAKGK